MVVGASSGSRVRRGRQPADTPGCGRGLARRGCGRGWRPGTPRGEAIALVRCNPLALRLVKRCATCKKPLQSKRADARTCSPACRQARYRAATEVPHDALAELWRDLRARFGDDVSVPVMRRILENKLSAFRLLPTPTASNQNSGKARNGTGGPSLQEVLLGLTPS
jgi:hypothetical protein